MGQPVRYAEEEIVLDFMEAKVWDSSALEVGFRV
jgi:hypothetical protein